MGPWQRRSPIPRPSVDRVEHRSLNVIEMPLDGIEVLVKMPVVGLHVFILSCEVEANTPEI